MDQSLKKEGKNPKSKATETLHALAEFVLRSSAACMHLNLFLPSAAA